SVFPLKLFVPVTVPWLIFVLFFFSSRRRHTRSYGDWSSDVCSSDLDRLCHPQQVAKAISDAAAPDAVFTCDVGLPTVWAARYLRSEERRVGKECRSRWWP